MALKYLTQAFIDGYAKQRPDWGPVGEITFYRSYSRWVDSLERRETWAETLTRVVEYSMSLDTVTPLEELREEAKSLFDTLYNMRGFVAGRTMWIGGTKQTELNGLANFNCSFHDIRSIRDFRDLVLILMHGCGGGLGLRSDSVAAFRSQGIYTRSGKIAINNYEFIGVEGLPGLKSEREGMLHLIVGDSREAWAQFVEDFLQAYLFGHQHQILITLDRIRPLGSRLKTFGGTASGPQAIVDFVHAVIDATRGKYDIDDEMLLDIGTAIGRMVVSGGTRRSALITLGDADSEAFRSAKTGEWYKDRPWRSQANNTIVFEDTPTKAELEEHFGRITQYGEPGLANGRAARDRRGDWRGLNACAEILLDSHQFCNLVSFNFAYLAKHGVDPERLQRDIRNIVRHNLRITNSEIKDLDPKWHDHQQRDRLLGVSFTGLGDYMALYDDAYPLLRGLRQIVHEEADRYADHMGIPRPLLKTTVKPEGTISLLYGASSGLHDPYAPYFIRRIRISASDAVSKVLVQLGVPNEVDQSVPNTLVFSFPVKTSAKEAAGQKPATDQLKRYFALMEAWVDHNASNTIYVAEEDIPEVIDLLLDNWDNYVAVSFLAKNNTSYPQMPFEEITQDQYEAMVQSQPDLSRLSEILTQLEAEMTAVDDLEGCESGYCPVR